MKSLLFILAFFTLIKIQAQNYDESKVPEYTLPDVLKTSAGTMIKDKSSWEKKRRSEVLQLFEDHVYGQMPVTYDSLKSEIINEVKGVMNGKSHLKEVKIVVWKDNKKAAIDLVLFIPD